MIECQYREPPHTCRKCGAASVRMEWKEIDDMLHFYCDRCGFTWTLPPLDKRGEESLLEEPNDGDGRTAA